MIVPSNLRKESFVKVLILKCSNCYMWEEAAFQVPDYQSKLGHNSTLLKEILWRHIDDILAGTHHIQLWKIDCENTVYLLNL